MRTDFILRIKNLKNFSEITDSQYSKLHDFFDYLFEIYSKNNYEDLPIYRSYTQSLLSDGIKSIPDMKYIDSEFFNDFLSRSPRSVEYLNTIKRPIDYKGYNYDRDHYNKEVLNYTEKLCALFLIDNIDLAKDLASNMLE